MSLMLRRLWIQLTADRKRFGLLCAMLAVGLLLWARVIVVSNIPRTAIADDDKAAKPVAQEPARIGAAMIDRLARDSVKVHMDDRPRRDPFVINPDYFPNPQVIDGRSQEPGKSGQKVVESEHELQLRQQLQRLHREVDRLKLEGVMHGAGLAVISGRTYRLGDDVPGREDESIQFQVVEVRSRSVVLQFEGHEFVLELALPK